MNNRWVKIIIAMVLAIGGSFVLTRNLFYPSYPAIRSDFYIKSVLLLNKIKNLKAPSDKLANNPPPWIMPVPVVNRPASPVPSSPIIYPTENPNPTYNPNRRITPLPPANHPPAGGANPTSAPIFNPPTAIPTQPPASAPSGNASSLLALINAQRQKEGVGTIVFNKALNKAAQKHAETTKECGHYSPDGKSPFDRVKDAGYPTPWVGENIACRVNTAQRAFDLWLGSPGHHANMVDSKWKSAGIGIARGYWVFVGGPV